MSFSLRGTMIGAAAALVPILAQAQERGIPEQPIVAGQAITSNIISSVIDYQDDPEKLRARDLLWSSYLKADEANLNAPEGEKGSTLEAFQAAFSALQSAEIPILEAYEKALAAASKDSTVIVAFYSDKHPLDISVLEESLREYNELRPYKIMTVNVDRYVPIYASYYPNTPYSDLLFEEPQVSVVHDGVFHNGISYDASVEGLGEFFSEALDPAFWAEEAFLNFSYHSPASS